MIRIARREAIAALSALFVLPACRREEASVGKQESPLVMVLSAAHGKQPERVKALKDFVAQHSGLAFDVHVAKNGEEALRMVGTPNTDAGLLTLFEYLFAHKQYGVEAGLQVVRRDGARTHEGEILVRADSAERSLADLAGKKFGYVDRYSTTGFLLAAKKLADAKVRVEPVFSGSHPAALDALRSGRVAAAAVYVGAAKSDPAFVSIAKTEPIPNEPVFFRAGLDPDKRRRVSEALIAFAASDAGRAALSDMADVTGFVPITSREYDAAFAMIQAAGTSVRDLVPRGWLVANERDRSPADLAP
jgi:phosphonate transport system substrate-binding protein